MVYVYHKMKHESSSKTSGKIRSKLGGKIRDENSKNRSTFVLQLFRRGSHNRTILQNFPWKLLNKNALQIWKFDHFMDTLLFETPCGPACGPARTVWEERTH